MGVQVNSSGINSFVFDGVNCTEVFFDGTRVFSSIVVHPGFNKGLFISNGSAGNSSNGAIKITNTLGGIESSTTTANSGKEGQSAASAGDLCLVFAGDLNTPQYSHTNTLERFNASGTKVGTSSGGYLGRFQISASLGASLSKAMFFSGFVDKIAGGSINPTTSSSLFNESGSLVLSKADLESSTGTGFNSNASQGELAVLFKNPTSEGKYYSKVNDSLAVVFTKEFSDITHYGVAGGCTIKSDTLWYGQYDPASGYVYKINSADSKVGSAVSVGISKFQYTGCNIGNNAVFAGGYNVLSLDYKKSVSINSSLSTEAINNSFNSISTVMISGGVN